MGPVYNRLRRIVHLHKQASPLGDGPSQLYVTEGELRELEKELNTLLFVNYKGEPVSTFMGAKLKVFGTRIDQS